LDYKGVKPEQAVKDFQRPLYIIAGSEDEYAEESGKELAQAAGSNATLEIVTTADHGTDIFQKEPAYSKKIVSWLKEHVP
jgi:hypothetical protein